MRKKLWKKICEQNWSYGQKCGVGLAAASLFWALVPALCGLSAGLVAGRLDETWLSWTLILSGYLSVGMGFLRNIIFLYNGGR